MYTWGNYLRDYWTLLNGQRREFVVFTFVRALANLAPFITAYLLGVIIDGFSGGTMDIELLLWLSSLIAGLSAFQVWLRFFSKKHLQNIGARVRKESRVRALQKLLLAQIDHDETGAKVQKITHGTENIYQGFKDFSNAGIQIITNLTFGLVIFAFTSWQFVLYSVVFAAIYLSGEYYFNKRLDYWQDQLNKIREFVSGKLHESASNVQTIKALGVSDAHISNAKDHEQKYYEVWEKTRDASQLKSKTIKMFSGFAYGAFIFLLGYNVLQGVLTVGLIYTYTSYFGRLRSALEELTNKSNDFIKVKSAVGRFMTLFGLREDADGTRNAGEFKSLEMKDVHFSYKERKVLDGFSLRISAGERIGIMGKSGAGKSTIIKLLLRLYRPDQGKIMLNGMGLNSIKRQSLTRLFTVAAQQCELFNQSLRENITMGVEAGGLMGVVRMAQLEGVVERLPEGLDTMIGEKGYKLSGGEMQRVSLARALYKEAPVLILDEATSALDLKTEKRIMRTLLQAGKTMIVISHRKSTLKGLDRVYKI
ncbi:MAG: ABC transporter ATP-binding protein [Candidatus Woesearchaeota archaeon]